MGTILKIEGFSGASGDMFLGALAGLLDAYDDLLTLPSQLKLEDQAEVLVTNTSKNGIACKQVKIKELVEQKSHRHLSNIIEIINNSNLSENAKNISLDIFNIIGVAEAEVHDIPIEKIHFHEVGAIDSILDICGTAYLIDRLNIDQTVLENLTVGKGFVKTAHGLLPVPCPATKLILEGIPYIPGNEDGEKLTPTGAAIIKYLSPTKVDSPLIDKRSSYGPGEKEFESPNLLRLTLCETADDSDEMIVIETNIDDSNSEFLGMEFQNKLKEIGVLDFYFSQIIMKKGRPGLLLTVVSKRSKLKDISDFILNFTSTIGVRYYPVDRIELGREIKTVNTEFGNFRIKVSISMNGEHKIKPESEDVLEYAIENELSPAFVTQKIIDCYLEQNT